MMKNSCFSRLAFSLVEVLAVVAGISLLTSAGYVTVVSVRESAQDNKLQAEVETINSAIRMYQSSGGTIPVDATAAAAIEKLKTRSDMSTAQGLVGMSGSFVDPRMTVSANGITGDRLRAIWNAAQSRFSTARSGSGFLFDIDETAAVSQAASETRSKVLLAADLTDGQPKWVWDFGDNSTTPTSGTGISPNSAPSLVTVESQRFVQGTFPVGPDGTVNLGYLWRDAGYNSRLGLFSLVGMGADVYDLSTPEGAREFLEEAIRRVLSDSEAGRVVADASQSGPSGLSEGFTFNPGDSLGAILIPNASFEEALAALESGVSVPDSIYYPLLSLALAADQAPFFASQMVHLGNGVYAVEDISGATSDNDYNDFLFSTGILPPEGSAMRTIDPLTYYSASYLNSVSPTTGKTFRQTLIEAGAIPAA